MPLSASLSYRVSRTLHWICATAFVFLAVSMPIALDLVNNSAERRFAHDVHQSVAILFTLMLTLRFGWMFYTKSSGLRTHFKHRWQFWMARINHSLLYFLMVTTPLSGFVFKVTSAKPVQVFGVELLPVIEALENEDWDYYASEFHLFIISIFYVLLFLHVAGAAMHVWQMWLDRRSARKIGLIPWLHS